MQQGGINDSEEIFLAGGSKLSATLDQLVDYAKNLEDREEAERLELMCYRLFGRRLTPEAADKIAEIPEHFKKRTIPTIGQLINNGTINDVHDNQEVKYQPQLKVI